MASKGSGACIYQGISPNVDTKDHYYLKGGGIGNQTASDPLSEFTHYKMTCVTRKQTLRSLSLSLYSRKVGDIPKEGWARAHVPILLLVWQRQRRTSYMNAHLKELNIIWTLTVKEGDSNLLVLLHVQVHYPITNIPSICYTNHCLPSCSYSRKAQDLSFINRLWMYF